MRQSIYIYDISGQNCKLFILTLLILELLVYLIQITKQEKSMCENLAYWIDAIWGRIKLMRKLRKYKKNSN